MKTPVESWIEMLLHSKTLMHEYDPIKAREYYLRTRELKGRATANSDPESVRRAREAEAKAEQKADDVEAQREALKEALKVQLEELEVRLEQLKAAVKNGKLAAMRRAGVSEETLSRMISQEVKSPGSTQGGTKDEKGEKDAEKGSDAEGESKDQKPKTQSQKNKDAKAAKERYEEEKKANPNPDDALEELQSKVDAAQEKIDKMMARVEAMKRIGPKKT